MHTARARRFHCMKMVHQEKRAVADGQSRNLDVPFCYTVSELALAPALAIPRRIDAARSPLEGPRLLACSHMLANQFKRQLTDVMIIAKKVSVV